MRMGTKQYIPARKGEKVKRRKNLKKCIINPPQDQKQKLNETMELIRNVDWQWKSRSVTKKWMKFDCCLRLVNEDLREWRRERKKRKDKLTNHSKCISPQRRRKVDEIWWMVVESYLVIVSFQKKERNLKSLRLKMRAFVDQSDDEWWCGSQWKGFSLLRNLTRKEKVRKKGGLS